jgi:TRAP-type C4-dicarboxylate transport system permease large subunit
MKGALLVVAIFATVIWLLIDQGLLSATGSRAIATIVLILVSIVLAIGMSWSHLNRRLTGQIDTDQVA